MAAIGLSALRSCQTVEPRRGAPRPEASPETAPAVLRRIQRQTITINDGAPITGVSTIRPEQASMQAALKLKRLSPDPRMQLL